MRSARRLAGWSIACGVTWAFTTTAAGAGLQAQPDAPPTAIEEAILEHACGALHPAGALESDAYLGCRQNQLLSLRDDFGRDLRRLSNAERRTIDSACSGLRISRGQDAYVQCLVMHLAPLRGRGGRSSPDTAGAAAPAPPAPPAVAPPPAAPPSSSKSGVWIGSALAALIVVAAGGVFAAARARRTIATCRTCGVKLAERGDLCQKCRHEAAEARRRATAERADQARAQEDEQRRQAGREDEQRQQRARDEEARRRQLDEEQQEQDRRREEQEQLRREEDARQQHQAGVAAAQDELDPYVVLGLPQEASTAEIEAAYQAARAKFDLELVADLGSELQEHFKRKAQMVERAYETLVARRPQ